MKRWLLWESYVASSGRRRVETGDVTSLDRAGGLVRRAGPERNN